MNVAISRAKNHLIVVANLTHLDRLLPSASLLRGVLYDIQEKGTVVHGSDLLALRPIERDLEGLLGRVKLDVDAETLGIFNHSAFDPAFEDDVRAAKESVVIFSGFVTPSRVSKLGDLLRAKVANGVKVRCVTRPPHRNGSMDRASSKEALDYLEGIGCVVDCRARIHEKVVLIDNKIVWHGSLNVLSHTHLTDESMTRLVNSGFAEAVAANIAKKRVSGSTAVKFVAGAENPRCGRCGARTVYDDGRYGPYFYCEDSCGWKVGLGNVTKQPGWDRAAGPTNVPVDGPPCPVCHGKTTLRQGPSKPFYGCKRFPACKGTVNIAKTSTKAVTVGTTKRRTRSTSRPRQRKLSSDRKPSKRPSR